MTLSIKPIETNYNGYRFRSRLEARWAVFFDKMGIKYEYEPEGFEIKGYTYSDDGSISDKIWYYLPDFYLPKSKTWIEVKGSFDNVADDYWYMLACAVDWGGYLPHIDESTGSERGLILLSGIPSPSVIPYFPIIQHGKGGRCATCAFESWGVDVVYNTAEDYFDSSWGPESGQVIKDHCKKLEHEYHINYNPVLQNALREARSARFERTERVECIHEVEDSVDFSSRVVYNSRGYDTWGYEKSAWDSVKRPLGIQDGLFRKIMALAAQWAWWDGDEKEDEMWVWWDRIYKLNKTDRPGEGLFDD